VGQDVGDLRAFKKPSVNELPHPIGVSVEELSAYLCWRARQLKGNLVESVARRSYGGPDAVEAIL
jgi:hypothetical protein